MKKYFLIFFISFSTSLFSQNQPENNLDSLLFLIKEIKENKQLSQQAKEKYASKILLLTKDTHDSLRFRVNIEIALFYFRKRDLDSLKKYSLIASKYATKLKDLDKIQKAHFYLATYYKYKEVPDSAYYHYNVSKNLLLRLGDTITAGRRLLNVSILQFKEKDLLGSEITTIESLKYVEKSELNLIKADLYNNLANVLKQRNELEEALKYYKVSLKYLNKCAPSDRATYSVLNYYNNVSLIHQLKGEYNKANNYIEKGLKLFKNSNHLSPYAYLLSNKAVNNYELGDKTNVLNLYFKVFEVRQQINDIQGMGIVSNLIAFYYRNEGDERKALFYAKEGLKYSKQSKRNDRILEALKLLSELTKGERAKEYLKEYIHLSDSLHTRERNMKNQFAKIRYETGKKEQENTVLKSENERKEAQLKSEKLQKTIGLISTGGTLALLGLSFLVFRNRRKRLLFQAQLEKAEAREKERQQIAKSLHDEVAGDLRILHQKLESNQQFEEAKNLYSVKENVRNLSHQLSSVSFDEVSFKDQIINLISDYFSPSFKIKASGINDINWKEIDNPIKRTLYLSIREAIQNTVKYAEASLITLSFEGLKKKYI